MEKGTLVEYIDNQRLICAVVLESVPEGDKRLRLFTEDSRIVDLPGRRITHAGGRLDADRNRQELSGELKQTAARRETLKKQVAVETLWNLFSPSEDWVSLNAMKAACFADQTTADHEAAVVRAMFEDGLYFKFDHNRFFPHSRQQINVIAVRKENEEKKKRIINEGAEWMQKMKTGCFSGLSDMEREYAGILRDYYVFEQESEEKNMARAMLAKAGGMSREGIFSLMVRLGIWDVHENIDLFRYRVPTDWTPEVAAAAEAISRAPATSADGRVNLSDLFIFTIDGSTTTDYDDALSLETAEDGSCRVGVHISDVAHHIKRDGLVDRAAVIRGSSIYTVDQKVPMLPPVLSEDACSLRAGIERPAISLFMRLTPFAGLVDYEIVPSLVRVNRHLSYGEADRDIERDPRLRKLNELASFLRQRRIQAGAVQITIPDLFIQFIEKDRVTIRRMEAVSPSRALVAEMMITANWLFATFLSKHQVPAVFRSQAEPRQRMVKKTDEPGTLFQNWVQRKMIARVTLNSEAEYHAGLGLERYTTATSPIRKYLDLMTQRQLRSILGLERPYTRDEVQGLIQVLEPVLTNVSRIQQARQRYWVLKYLESKIGVKEEAIVLDSFMDDYSVLLPHYLLECRLSKSSGTSIKPKDLIQVTIQHVNARNNTIAIYLG